MAEGTYEYECMRAELLGIEKPDYDEFMRFKKEQEAQDVAEEENDTENLKEADSQSEGIRNLSGGLDELNSILQVTQRKINKFKVTCGSLTNLLKIKMGQGSSSDIPANTNQETEISATEDIPQTEATASPPTEENSQNGTTPVRKSDLARALDNHNDRFDEMIEKAENAQFTMNYQRKQMQKLFEMNSTIFTPINYPHVNSTMIAQLIKLYF